MLSEGAYGNVVEAEFKQVVARKGGRIVALERYALDPVKMRPRRRWWHRRLAALTRCSFRGSGGRAAGRAGHDRRRPRHQARPAPGHRIVGRPAHLNDAKLQGGWYAAPDSAGFRNFSARYRTRYNQDPVRTATLAYDAVALVAALVKTQGQQRFSEQVLTSASGFAGIDGCSASAPTAPPSAGFR